MQSFFTSFIFLFLLYWMFISASSMVGVRSIFEILCVVILFTGAIVGLISFFIMTATTSYITTVSAYSLLIVGTSLLFGFMLNNIYNYRKNSNSLNGKINWLGQIIVNILPFFLMVLNLGYLLYLITVNKAIITSGNVNNDYNIFSKIFIILTIIQISMIYYGINTSSSGTFIPIYNALLVLISIVNFYIIRVIKIVIVDYPVDCLVNLCSTSTTSTTTPTPTTTPTATPSS